jgi:hypothetical protein
VADLEQLWVKAVEPRLGPVHVLADLGAHAAVHDGDDLVVRAKDGECGLEHCLGEQVAVDVTPEEREL